MKAHHVIDGRTEGRLAGFGQPLIGRECRKIRTPDAIDKSRLVRDRHAAGRRSQDQGQPAARIGRLSRQRRAHGADRPGMGVDQSRADGKSHRQTHRFSGGAR